MKRLQRGFTLYEVMGALAIATLMMAGLSALIDTSLEDTKAQQAALHQSQVAAAAAKYISANYAALSGLATSTSPVAIPVNTLKGIPAGSTPYLPSSFSVTNPYGQTPCVLVLQPTSGKLDALVVTEGGNAIGAQSLAYSAANAGQGGGYIPVVSTPPVAKVAKGAYGSWSVSSAQLTNYLSQNCSGTAAAEGHLATGLFYDGPGQLSTDFVYRDKVDGRPELNRMSTPLHMTRIVTEGSTDAVSTSDTYCTSSAPSTYGKIAVDANGAVLSCREGTWKRYGSGSWKDPVASYAALTALAASGNNAGDVRMVTALNRAFTWDGVALAWKALAVDQNGNLTVGNTLTTNDMQLNSQVVSGAACTSNGLVARDTDGLVMSCQSGKWSPQSTIELGASYMDCRKIRPSTVAPGLDPDCPTIFPQASVTHTASTDTWTATYTQSAIPVTKNGLISVSAWSQMNRGRVSAPSAEGQVALTVNIKNSSGTIIASSSAQSPSLHNDSAAINVALSKSVPKDSSGYSVDIITYYSLFDDGTNAISFNQANYTANGSTVQQTPLRTAWNIDVFY